MSITTQKLIHAFMLLLLPGLLVAGELEELKARFDTGLTKVELRHQTDLDVVHEKYLGMLQQLKSSYAKSGELDPTLFVSQEIKQFTKSKALPDPEKAAKFPTLQRLQKGYVAAVQELQKKQNLEMLDIGEKYKQMLKSLKTKLTQQDKLDEALLVRGLEQEVEADPRFQVRTDLIASKPKPPPRSSGFLRRPGSSGGNWTTMFRSSNPALWNTDTREGKNLAVSLSKAPDQIQYLRLKQADSTVTVIIPMTKDQLGAEPRAGAIRWIGSKRNYREAIMLGIYNTSSTTSSSRDVQFRDYTTGRRHPGWGFGITYQSGAGYVQGYTWNGSSIEEPTIFDISVSPGPLSPEEQKLLLEVGANGAVNDPALSGDDIITLKADTANLKGNTKLENGVLTGISGDNEFVEFILSTAKPAIRPGRYEIFMSYTMKGYYGSTSTSSGTAILQSVRDISRYRGDAFRVTPGNNDLVKKKITSQGGTFSTVSFGQLQVSPLLKFQLAFAKGSYYADQLQVRWLKLKPVK